MMKGVPLCSVRAMIAFFLKLVRIMVEANLPRKYREEEATNPYARRMAILELVYSSSGPVRTNELTTRFHIESNLLSYDLQRLEELGLVERGFGWVRRRAMEAEALFPESEFASRLRRETPAKKMIAEYIAEELIPPGSQVAFDAGTTAYFVASALVEKRKSVTIWTNNIPLFLYTASRSDMPCHLVGGELNRAQAALTGDWAARQISEIKFDVGILVPKGVLLSDVDKAKGGPLGYQLELALREKGAGDNMKAVVILFNEDPKQLAYKRAIALNANRVIIPVTRGKFTAVGLPFLLFILAEPLGYAVGAVRTRGAIPVRLSRDLDVGVSYAFASHLLRSPEAVVRQAAVEALAEIGGAQATDLLLPLLKDVDGGVRKATERALAKLAGEREGMVDLRKAGEVILVTDASPQELCDLCPDAEGIVDWGQNAGSLVFLKVF